MPPSKLIISIEEPSFQAVTLSEAKNWLQMSPDQIDWDDLITTLLSASIDTTEKNSGQLLSVRNVTIKNNPNKERVYPVGPWIEDVTTDASEVKNYIYEAGYYNVPMTLKVAVLQRVATGFAYRQNGISEAVNQAINLSVTSEMKFREDLWV
jgi:hypothetical protein